MTYEIPNDDAADSLQFAVLFESAARVLLKSDEKKAFLDWIAEAGPVLAPAVAKLVDPRTGPVGDFFRTMGVAILRAMPLPQHDYRPQKVAIPGRNEPCLCGSGRKFKHCCQRFGEQLDLRGYNLLRYVLECQPQKSFAALPATHVDVLAVWDVARQWREEGEVARAIALLEPWFSDATKLRATLEPHFDELMDCYLDLGKPRKREQLVEKVIAHGDKALHAAALQRRAAMRADSGDIDGAWQAFREAQRVDPDNPAHATLELTLLVAQGDVEQARERSRFWIAKLERRRDPALAHLIEFLHEVREDPLAAVHGVERRRFPGLDKLAALLEAAPPPAAHYLVRDQGEDEHALEADESLAAVERRWHEVFEQAKPMLTGDLGPDEVDLEGLEDGLDFLAGHPLAWQSFDVLDDIVLAAGAVPTVTGSDPVVEALLDRAGALLQENLRGTAVPPGQLSWFWLQNRPALRLLSEAAMHAAQDPARGAASDEFIEHAELMLALNPNDNHYLRESLSRAYLARGWPDKAIDLTGRYPDDFCGMSLNRILALYRAGRETEARESLREAASDHEAAIKMLLADQPRAPKPDSAYGITMGGKYEAWLYRSAALALWQEGGALAWLKKAWRELRR